MSSDSGSESDSNPSGGEESPNRTVAPTPGHGLDRSNSNSPDYGNKSQASPNRSRSRNSASSGSRSSSAASNHTRTGSRSRSPSAGSNKSGSGRSNKSAASNRSRSQSAGSGSHRSNSAGSNLSRSNRSGSRSRSGTPASNRSGSASNRSRSRSKSAESRRSGSGSERSRSRSKSHDRSGSNSPNLQIDEPHDDKNEKDDGGKEGVSAAAIFGDDADDISSEEEKEKSIASDREEEVQRRRSVDDVERVGPVSDEEPEPRSTVEEEEEKEAEPEPIPETRIDVEIPKISCDLGKDISFVKLPNFLSVETRPFDPETYEDEIDEEETLDEEGRARLKLKVENTIRWREIMDDEGNLKKESNARMVRWSDGSFSLHLGSEIFDVYRQPLQGDHNHLFIRQGTGLQGQAVFRTKLSFRPHSTESFTHRKMTISLADRSQKTSGIKILSQVGVDPDHDKATRLKKEEEKLRQTIRSSKPRRKGDGGVRSHNISNVYREEDGSDEDGAISLNAIKNKYKSSAHVAGIAAKGGAIYSSDEEGSDIEDRRNRKSDKAKALKDSDSGEESD